MNTPPPLEATTPEAPKDPCILESPGETLTPHACVSPSKVCDFIRLDGTLDLAVLKDPQMNLMKISLGT
jgi:hypothetical protein